MLRSILNIARLTLRLNRFEVAVVSSVAIVMASALAIATHLSNAAGVAPECFLSESDLACRSGLERFYTIQNDTAWLRGQGAGLVPVFIGLILGVPIVAREREARTLTLAWSMTGNRLAWLSHRFVPILVFAIAVLTTLAILELAFQEASLAGQAVGVDRVGVSGATFATRGLMALSVGLLAGAATGRSLPAFVVAGAALLLIALVGLAWVREETAQQLAGWVELPYVAADDAFLDPDPPMFEFQEEFRLSDGGVLDYDEVYGALYDQLGADGLDPAAWFEVNVVRAIRIVPASRFGTFELVEGVLTTSVALASLGATLLVVRRIRPR